MDEERKKTTSDKLKEKGLITAHIHSVFDDQNNFKKEIKYVKKQEQEVNLKKHRRV